MLKLSKSFFKGEFFIILCSVFWGLISLFSLPLNEKGFTSAEITFTRSLLAALFLGLYILLKDRQLFKISFKGLLFTAFIGIGCFMTVCFLYTVSIQENGSAIAVMLMYTSPVWTVVISRFVFKEKITLVKIISLFGILGGCAMLSFGGELHLSGVGLLLGLATGLFLSLYVVFSKVAGRKYSAETITFYVFVFSALAAFFVSSAWNIPTKIAAEPVSIWYFAGISGLSTAAAYLLYTAGLKTVSAGKASMISTLEIVVASVVGITVFGVNAGVIGYLGIIITVSSLVFLEICDLKRGKKVSSKKDFCAEQVQV